MHIEKLYRSDTSVVIIRVSSFLRFERRSRSDIEWSIIRRRKIARAPRLHETIADPRCGVSAFRRVQLLVFKVAGKKRRPDLSPLAKTADSGPVESFMRPTKRVARLRATNNSCLYPFCSLSSSSSSPCLFVLPLSPANTRASLFFLPPRLFSVSFPHRSNSNSCRKKPGNLS